MYRPDSTLRDLKLVLKALADVSRLRIVQELANGSEVSVTALALALKVSQPLLSWHLRFLRRAGLVSTRREGRTVYCSLNRERWRWALSELTAIPAPAAAGAPERAGLAVERPVEA